MKFGNAAHAAQTRLKRWFGFVRLLSALAFVLSGYLLWNSFSGEQLPGCGLESGCGEVLHSRWAYWFAVPVSLPALLIYGMILAATVTFNRPMSLRTEQRVWGLLIFAAVTLVGAAAWFIGLQVFVVRAICPFCMTAHACGFLVGVLILVKAFRRDSVSLSKTALASPAGRSPVNRARFVFAGLAALVILVTCQVFYRPRTYAVTVMTIQPSNLVATNGFRVGSNTFVDPARPGAFSDQSGRQTRRVLQLHGDVFNLELHNVPLIGSPDAPYVIVSLFDYSCQHCRLVHPILGEVFRSLSNQVAIVSLPVPLDPVCNRLIKTPMPDHTNACAYARAGLAVWRAAPGKLPAFDDWMFSPPRPPSPEAARAEAMRLVGTNAFIKALGDPWIDQQLDLGIRIYATNYYRYRKSQLPELMIGTNIVSGTLQGGDLFRVLSNQFNLRSPVPPREGF